MSVNANSYGFLNDAKEFDANFMRNNVTQHWKVGRRLFMAFTDLHYWKMVVPRVLDPEVPRRVGPQGT